MNSYHKRIRRVFDWHEAVPPCEGPERPHQVCVGGRPHRVGVVNVELDLHLADAKDGTCEIAKKNYYIALYCISKTISFL